MSKVQKKTKKAKTASLSPSDGNRCNGCLKTNRMRQSQKRALRHSGDSPEAIDDEDQADREPVQVRPPTSSDSAVLVHDDGPYPGDEDGDDDDSFLVDRGASRGPGAAGVTSDVEKDDGTAGWANWYKSKAFELIYHQKGSDLLPGNYGLFVPNWVKYFFQDPVKAMVFSQILRWFGPSARGGVYITRHDGQGHPVLDKTHAELAAEVGIKKKRRLEGLMKAFCGDNLLDYDPCHGTGKGRTTRIWLKPEGVLAAYRVGCKRAKEVEDERHDRFGGS